MRLPLVKEPFDNPDYIFELKQDYAAIGSSIGHEISHTFDPQGSAFDSTRVSVGLRPSMLGCDG